jgi:hypothetical protein
MRLPFAGRSARVAVIGAREDLELAGLQGRFEWGGVWAGSAEEAAGAAKLQPELMVTLGAHEPAELPDAGTWVAWQRGGRSASRADRVIAQEGEGIWHRAPWPVNDPVFELAGKQPDGVVLVVGGSESRRTEVCDALRDDLAPRDVVPASNERLELEGLGSAGIVAMLGDPDEPLPAEAMAVLAARRLLITARFRPSFGLQEQIDHLAVVADRVVPRYVAAALAYPRAVDGIRAWGALAAERHRASVIYGRLLAELEVAQSAGSGRDA